MGRLCVVGVQELKISVVTAVVAGSIPAPGVPAELSVKADTWLLLELRKEM